MHDMGAGRIGDLKVASLEPASLTITSRTTPRTAAGIRLSKQRGSRRSALTVGMTTEIMTAIMTQSERQAKEFPVAALTASRDD